MIVRSQSKFSTKVDVFGTVTKTDSQGPKSPILVRSLGRYTCCEIDFTRYIKAKETIILHSAYTIFAAGKYDNNN